jgi:hypothetical protein
MAPYGVYLDFERDILPLSRFSEGGSVTERHLLFALGLGLVETAGRAAVAAFLKDCLGLSLTEIQEARLSDVSNPYFDYDLLDVLKARLVGRIYVPATDECLSLAQAKELAAGSGALLCYEYLGNTGDLGDPDKKTQRFEDACLDDVARVLADYRVDGVTYMPSRGAAEQHAHVRELCARYGFKEILGEDISSPRQPFIVSQLEQPEYAHLVCATWELVKRDRAPGGEV